MPSRETVLGLMETRAGFRIDTTRLSNHLRVRLEQFQAMKMRLDELDEEIDILDRKGRDHLVLLTLSLAFGVLGVTLGLLGVSAGVYDLTEATLSLVAGGGLLAVCFYVAAVARRTRRVNLERIAESVELASDLDAGIGGAYQDVLDELAVRQRPAQSRQFRNY